MIFKKPENLRYVDMCIYVDKNVPQLLDPDCPTEIQDTIYNYLWLLVKALAIKKRMFKAFQDYDGYSFYAANRLYFALKKNLENQGKIVKGKEIRPIKSCLNYTKALLYPMKIEYLRNEQNLDYTEQETSKNFDEFMYRQRLKDEVWQSNGCSEAFQVEVRDFFNSFSYTMDEVLKKSPFPPNSPDYKKIKISVLLNALANLKHGKGISMEPVTVMLWKLPKSTGGYIKLFLKELGTEMMQTVMSYHDDLEIDDEILKYMLTNPDGEFIEHENSKY